MQSAISVKAGAAFLAGVLVALGGAVIYFKASDLHVRPPAQVATMAETSSSVPDMSTPQKPEQSPAPEATPVQPQVTSNADDTVEPVLKKSVHKRTPYSKPKPRITSRPVSLSLGEPKTFQAQEETAQNLLPPPIPVPPSDTVLTPPVSQAVSTLPEEARQPHTVTIPAGTSVAVRLAEKLSTDHNFSGDTFRATLDTPITMDGFIIADRGAKVLGRIVKAQKAGKFEGMSELSLTLTQISTTDGQQMRVETNESLRKGQSNTNEEVLKMGGGAALGAIIGALAGGGKGAAIGAGAGGATGAGAVLLGHGKPAVIDNESRLTFTLAAPTTLTEHLN